MALKSLFFLPNKKNVLSMITAVKDVFFEHCTDDVVPVFVVMMNKKGEDGAFTNQLSGQALVGLRGVRPATRSCRSWSHT